MLLDFPIVKCFDGPTFVLLVRWITGYPTSLARNNVQLKLKAKDLLYPLALECRHFQEKAKSRRMR